MPFSVTISREHLYPCERDHSGDLVQFCSKTVRIVRFSQEKEAVEDPMLSAERKQRSLWRVAMLSAGILPMLSKTQQAWCTDLIKRVSLRVSKVMSVAY
mmetsp:Transcript_26481/g.40496  ORF Transcript_26481/g.40496 Transcript_26481/m.40496 type:complete len:99 (+) Transcript_26481:1388-1684(+)